MFRWNSTFDTDFTSTGHQPLYRDTYASIYDHYSVVSAKATVTVQNGTSASPFIVGMVTDDDTSLSSTLDTLMEQNHGISRLVSPLSGNASNVTLRANWNCAEVLNIDPFTSETYKTAVASNPDETSTLGIYCASTDASTNTITFRIILEQEVLWTELTTPSQS